MRILDRLTYANVLSTLLAFVVLGGGTAVALDGKNTVDSGDVVNSTLKGKDVKDNTVTGADIDEASLSKVPDADRIDGIDGAELARKSEIPAAPTDDERTLVARVTLPADDAVFADNTVLFTIPGLGPVSVRCEADDDLIVDFVNQSGAPADVYGQVTAPVSTIGGDYDVVANGNGEQLANLSTAGLLDGRLSTREPAGVRVASLDVTLVSTADASPGCVVAATATVAG